MFILTHHLVIQINIQRERTKTLEIEFEIEPMNRTRSNSLLQSLSSLISTILLCFSHLRYCILSARVRARALSQLFRQVTHTHIDVYVQAL